MKEILSKKMETNFLLKLFFYYQFLENKTLVVFYGLFVQFFTSIQAYRVVFVKF